MSFTTAAQQAIFTALNENITASVYDEAPGLPSGQPDANFPYVVIGDDTASRWDADDMLGADITITLHFWSRYEGWKEIKSLMGEVYDILHRGDLTLTGYNQVNCVWEFSTTVPEATQYRHGTQRYRLILTKE